MIQSPYSKRESSYLNYQVLLLEILGFFFASESLIDSCDISFIY